MKAIRRAKSLKIILRYSKKSLFQLCLWEILVTDGQRCEQLLLIILTKKLQALVDKNMSFRYKYVTVKSR